MYETKKLSTLTQKDIEPEEKEEDSPESSPTPSKPIPDETLNTSDSDKQDIKEKIEHSLSPELEVYYDNLDNRTLWIDEEINEKTIEYVKHIISFNREDNGIPYEDREPIKLMILSPGGYVYMQRVLVDVIKLSKTPVVGYNMGKAYSAACSIFISCHYRFALPGSSFLIHRGSGGLAGNYNDMTAHMEEYERDMDALEELIINHSKISENMLKEKLKGDWYITAKEACCTYGFVDEIVKDIDLLI